MEQIFNQILGIWREFEMPTKIFQGRDSKNITEQVKYMETFVELPLSIAAVNHT